MYKYVHVPQVFKRGKKEQKSLFQIYETSWDNQEGIKYGQPQEFESQEQADGFCDNLSERREGYLYIAKIVEP